MKALIMLAALALILALPSSGRTPQVRCPAGSARAFVAIQDEPPYLVGTIPSSFTAEARYFARRYNCKGRSAQARRVGLGVYEVRFPGLLPRLALATAISSEGVSASVETFGEIVRISLRGPLGGSDVASRRDVPFSVVVF